MAEKTESDVVVTFGKRIRALRKSRGLSQVELASLCGLDRSYIGSVERGDRNISLINIHKISVALNIAIEELFRGLND